MIPHTFRIGNNVEVIGPSITGNDIHLGETFKIKCMYVNPSQHIQFDPYDGTYYPASSLQLVEELKIGDWVEVVGSPKYFPQYPAKTIFCIIKGPPECKGILGFGGIRNCVDCYCGEGTPFYEANSLRKLTPEEIKQHIAPKLELSQEAKEKIRDLVSDAITGKSRAGIDERLVYHDGLLEGMDKRLSAIESRIEKSPIGCHESVHDELTEQLSAIEKRLDFVEKFQREQTRDALYKGWMAGP